MLNEGAWTRSGMIRMDALKTYNEVLARSNKAVALVEKLANKVATREKAWKDYQEAIANYENVLVNMSTRASYAKASKGYEEMVALDFELGDPARIRKHFEKAWKNYDKVAAEELAARNKYNAQFN